jgi:hypothetical protein
MRRASPCPLDHPSAEVRRRSEHESRTPAIVVLDDQRPVTRAEFTRHRDEPLVARFNMKAKLFSALRPILVQYFLEVVADAERCMKSHDRRSIVGIHRVAVETVPAPEEPPNAVRRDGESQRADDSGWFCSQRRS